MNPNEHSARLEDLFATRRQFLNRFGLGLGALSLASMFSPSELLGADPHAMDAAAAAAGNPLAPRAPHFPAKAKAVIHVFAQGAPSQVDTWDPKPTLTRMDGKTLPDGGIGMASPFKFEKKGKSGIEVSEVFPNLGNHVDDMAIIRSMWTDIPAHEVATVFMNTGSLRLARPSVGSWAVYGLGSQNQNLPGFISLRPGGGLPLGGTSNWQPSFLPGVYAGTSVNTSAQTVFQMIQNIRNQYTSTAEQRRALDYVQQLNEVHAQNLQKEAALEARLEAYEIAFRMQAEATDAFDVNKEPANMRALYGNSPQGKQMLIARRLVERGVRFVQVWAGGWDHHQDLETKLSQKAEEIDKPLAALLTDLKQRGLLDSTLVVWGGEFGRKPTKDRNGNENPGRDHNNRGFTTWLAGGGVKGGTVYGATDEFGAKSVQDKVHVHDLHATMLHLLGFDHTKLTYRSNGRDFRLTDVAGSVVKGIVA